MLLLLLLLLLVLKSNSDLRRHHTRISQEEWPSLAIRRGGCLHTLCKARVTQRYVSSHATPKSCLRHAPGRRPTRARFATRHVPITVCAAAGRRTQAETRGAVGSFGRSRGARGGGFLALAARRSRPKRGIVARTAKPRHARTVSSIAVRIPSHALRAPSGAVQGSLLRCRARRRSHQSHHFRCLHLITALLRLHI